MSAAKGPLSGKSVPAPLSALSRTPSGTALYRSFSSPFSSPRKSLSSPSILRRKGTTPTNKNVHKLVDNAALPALPTVNVPDQKDVQSIVMSPRWVCPAAARRAATKPPEQLQSGRAGGAGNASGNTRHNGSGAQAKASRSHSRNRKKYYSGRVFVTFNVEDEEEPMPHVVAPPRAVSNGSTQKRKRAVYEPVEEEDEEDEEEPEQIDEEAEAQFSSNVSQVLLAMACLQDEQEEATPGDALAGAPLAAGPEAELLSQLFQVDAESSAQAAKPELAADEQGGAAGSNTTGGGLTPSPTLASNVEAESDASNETGSLAPITKLMEPASRNEMAPTSAEQLVTSLQASVTPGIIV